jgi:hypothetical protein
MQDFGDGYDLSATQTDHDRLRLLCEISAHRQRGLHREYRLAKGGRSCRIAFLSSTG